MDDKAEKDAESKAAGAKQEPATKKADTANKKVNPEPAVEGDEPTQESVPDDNDMFG
jgi:hypothetical protein